MSECKVQTTSLNPQLLFSIPVNGSIIPIYVNENAINIAAVTFAFQFSRVSIVTADTITVLAGNLRFLIFSNFDLIEVVPLPIGMRENSFIFTTKLLNCGQTLSIGVESSVPADTTLNATVTLASQSITFSVCVETDCCCKKDKKKH